MPKKGTAYFTQNIATDSTNTPGPVPIAVDPTTGAIATSAAGTFLIPQYNSFEVTYVAAGNGAGEIETVVYKLSGTTVATLTFAYNADDKVSSVTLS